MAKMTNDQLKILQALPLDIKIRKTEIRIREWYEHWEGNVYVSFSGGKDSTVLLDIVRRLYPDVPAVFSDTGLEYPEVKQFVKSDNNIIIRRPEINFFQCIVKYGYPIISKEISQCICEARVCPGGAQDIRMHGEYINPHNGKVQFNHKKYLPLMELPIMFSNKCCNYLKKKPAKQYEKETGNYAITAGLTAKKDGLFIEGADSPYVNILTVKAGNENNPAIQALVELIKSQKVKDYIEKTYPDGDVVPVF